MPAKKIVSVVGARPQFIKEAVVGRAFRASGAWNYVLVHSGQHYDADMAEIFFRELEIARPDHLLGIGSGTHGKQTGEALIECERVFMAERPDCVLVYGDTNTTLAAALAASKLKIPVCHVEAGLRQEPRDMPEETNRVLTDHISKLLFCCSEVGRENLAREGITRGVHVVGDVMYDLYRRMEPHFDARREMARLGVEENAYLIATLHRDFNVDDPARLRAILAGIGELSREAGLKVLLPLHPRTRKRIVEFNLQALVEPFLTTDPLGYFELMSLLRGCALVVTDSGGFQKEACFAGKGALVLMPDSAWRELFDSGLNVLADDPASIIRKGRELLDRLRGRDFSFPPNIYGDGRAAERIADLCRRLI